MKSNFFKILFVAAAIVALSSCGSDDETDLNGGYVYNGETYIMVNGFIDKYGENNAVEGQEQSYDFDITLYGGSVNYSENSDDFSGQGPLIYIDLHSRSEDGIVPGTYNYSVDPDNEKRANTVVDILFAPDYNFDTNNGDSFEATSGDVIINVNSTTYTVAINLLLDNGKNVKGTFTGDLSVYER